MNEIMTIALLGQPNSGKSTFYNALTGSHQHVGNWPGKTVERNSGTFQYNGNTYKVVDLPGTYSLAANSEEEIVTRDYIAGGEADLVCILADASQLERSLFMLADYAGIRVPVVLLLNMMDVAKVEGKKINFLDIEKNLEFRSCPLLLLKKRIMRHFMNCWNAVERKAGFWMPEDCPYCIKQNSGKSIKMLWSFFRKAAYLYMKTIGFLPSWLNMMQ